MRPSTYPIFRGGSAQWWIQCSIFFFFFGGREEAKVQNHLQYLYLYLIVKPNLTSECRKQRLKHRATAVFFLGGGMLSLPLS